MLRARLLHQCFFIRLKMNALMSVLGASNPIGIFPPHYLASSLIIIQSLFTILCVNMAHGSFLDCITGFFIRPFIFLLECSGPSLFSNTLFLTFLRPIYCIAINITYLSEYAGKSYLGLIVPSTDRCNHIFVPPHTPHLSYALPEMRP